jgi:hypothetical protein
MSNRRPHPFVGLASTIVAVALSACSSVSSQKLLTPQAQEAQNALKDFYDSFGPDWAVDTTEDGLYITSLTGVPTRKSLIDEKGSKLLPYLSRLTGATTPATYNDEPKIVHAGTLIQYRYPQKIAGREVENAEFIVQVDTRGGPYDILLNGIPDAAVPDAVRTPADAVALVEGIIRNEMKLAYEQRGDKAKRRSDVPEVQAMPRIVAAAADTAPHLLAVNRRLYNVYEVRVRAYVVADDEHETLVALRIYSVDAASTTQDENKAIIRIRNLIHTSVTGKARVFMPNPVNSLAAGGTITAPWCPPIDFELVDPPYAEKPLPDLDSAVNGKFALLGPSVCLKYDRTPPNGPTKLQQTDFSYKRGTVDFAAANLYFHISQLAQRATDLGFSDLVRPRLEVEAFDQDADDPEAAFIEGDGALIQPHLTFSRRRLSGIYVAEDADIIAHEYAHSLLQKKTGNQFLLDQQSRGKNEAGAINEGFADYWSLSAFAKQSADHQFTLNCYGEWAFCGRCFRDYPSLSHDKFEDTKGIHENGEIWSGTLFEILSKTFKMATNAADDVILRGHLQRASKTTAPTMKEMAEGIVIADGDSNRADLCAIFKAHDIWPLVCCEKKPCVANRLTLPN